MVWWNVLKRLIGQVGGLKVSLVVPSLAGCFIGEKFHWWEVSLMASFIDCIFP